MSSIGVLEYEPHSNASVLQSIHALVCVFLLCVCKPHEGSGYKVAHTHHHWLYGVLAHGIITIGGLDDATI